MTVLAAQTHFTPEDILRLEDEGLYELVDGKLAEKRMGSLSSKTTGLLIRRIGKFLDESNAGELYPEQTFQCFPNDPDRIRRPDIAYISAEHLPAVPDEGHVPIAPDLAIEVVSPNDKIYELDEKLSDYRMAAIKLIWVVNPNSRTIRIHRLDRTYAELQETDTLSGEAVLPGFSILVREMLPSRAKAK